MTDVSKDPLASIRAAANSAASYEFFPEEEAFEIEDNQIILEPVAGARVIGHLNETEKRMYRIMVSVEAEIDDIFTELQRSLNLQIVNAFASGQQLDPSQIGNLRRSGQANNAAEYFRLQAMYGRIGGAFWYIVRSRLQTFTTILEIRAGYSVCGVGSKIGD